MNAPHFIRKHKWLVVSVFALLAILLIQLLSRSRETQKSGVLPKVDLSKPSTWARAFKPLPVSYKKLQAIVRTPIEFYGRVEDQHGKPISGATVKIYPVDNKFGTSSANNMVMTSDAEGRFSVKDLRGFSVGVSVSKEGYIYISPTRWPSSSCQVYADDGSGKGKRYSNPNSPLILRLYDPGQMEPMVYVRSRRCKMPVTGQPHLIALDSEKGVGTHQIEFRFKSDWHKLPDENASNFKQYDWNFEARIPGGGFAWSSNDYEFVAPETGYSESIKVAYKADMPPEQWKKLAQGSFFVKFADGCHGRIRFEVAGSSKHSPLTLQSWFNPKPGSRNLSTLHMSSSMAGDERNKIEWQLGP